MKRNRLARSTPEQARAWRQRSKRLAPRSAARADQDWEYAEAKAAALVRDGNRCQGEARVPGVTCAGRLDPHHVWPTGNGGPRCDVANLLTLCRAHHDWTHNNNRAARVLGMLA